MCFPRPPILARGNLNPADHREKVLQSWTGCISLARRYGAGLAIYQLRGALYSSLGTQFVREYGSKQGCARSLRRTKAGIA